MLRDLLAKGHNEEVLKLVTQLLLRNGELEKRLARRRLDDSHSNESERISSEQLDLFLQALQQQAQQSLNEANQKLQQAAQAPDKPPAAPKPPRQPAVRRP